MKATEGDEVEIARLVMTNTLAFMQSEDTPLRAVVVRPRSPDARDRGTRSYFSG
jgi:hypothetical protein